MLFDEVVFQQQRFQFAFGHNKLNIGNLFHQPPCFGAAEGSGFMKIRAHPVL
jgi:hypothetical protein